MDEREHPPRKPSVLRLLAIALAGALGAFGAPVGAHAASGAPSGAVPLPAATAPDAQPD